ncbi:uncharacterized protein LOC118184209 isoform X1 [Stegodyphus dumicola]|uniref:uncharacterized protein LOC118184209 isoform X1 n=1 Tax=Stegodyphus dumicola TaxID=202533 RepID=UPI0015AB5D2A|nr:uncharacterized protein LOC118184209 isoform X1 [Stegodyphus dumicola]
MARKAFFPPDTILPMRVTQQKWICVMSPQLYEMKIDYSKVGKWLLFFDHEKECEARGLTDHELVWQYMKYLVYDHQNTHIMGAKCSTAWEGPRNCSPNCPNGVICCYTDDYTNKLEVKIAADAIRRIINDKCQINTPFLRPIYYKTDEATYAGLYTYLGNKHISTYMHSCDNVLFERDEFGHWQKVEF